MRRVKLYKAQYNQDKHQAETVERCEAIFHQFMNRSVVDSNGKVLLEIVAICELKDGSLTVVSPDNMKFVSDNISTLIW